MRTKSHEAETHQWQSSIIKLTFLAPDFVFADLLWAICHTYTLVESQPVQMPEQ
jgi:hypothetical protein